MLIGVFMIAMQLPASGMSVSGRNMRAAMVACEIITPLGAPVEPDVNRTKARLSGVTEASEAEMLEALLHTRRRPESWSVVDTAECCCESESRTAELRPALPPRAVPDPTAPKGRTRAPASSTASTRISARGDAPGGCRPKIQHQHPDGANDEPNFPTGRRARHRLSIGLRRQQRRCRAFASLVLGRAGARWQARSARVDS